MLNFQQNSDQWREKYKRHNQWGKNGEFVWAGFEEVIIVFWLMRDWK